MLKRTVRFGAISAVALLAFTSPAMASGKGKVETTTVKSSMSNSKIVTGGVSTWISPATPETSTYAVKVEAGSTIPLKFKLFTSDSPSVEVTSGNIVLTTEPVTCPVNVPSPAPTASKLTQVTPGKAASSTLRYLGKTWNANWKLDKQAQGCFKFKATLAAKSLVLTSPTIVVYPKR